MYKIIENVAALTEVCLDSYREIGRFTSYLENPKEVIKDNGHFIHGTIEGAFVGTFPGTRNWVDILVDINKWGTNLDEIGRHQGFSEEFDDMLPEIQRVLPMNLEVPLIFTAHSKGAAMARYLALYCANHGYKDITLITFGEPKCLTVIPTALNDAIKTRRYVYGYDPVPRLGFLFLSHQDKEIHIGPKRRWWAFWDWGKGKHITHHKMSTYRDYFVKKR